VRGQRGLPVPDQEAAEAEQREEDAADLQPVAPERGEDLQGPRGHRDHHGRPEREAEVQGGGTRGSLQTHF